MRFFKNNNEKLFRNKDLIRTGIEQGDVNNITIYSNYFVSYASLDEVSKKWLITTIYDKDKNCETKPIFMHNFEYLNFDDFLSITPNQLFQQIDEIVKIDDKFSPVNFAFLRGGVLNFSLRITYQDRLFSFTTNLDISRYSMFDIKEKLSSMIKDDISIRRMINNGIIINQLNNFQKFYHEYNPSSTLVLNSAFRKSSYSSLKCFVKNFDIDKCKQFYNDFNQDYDLKSNHLKYLEILISNPSKSKVFDGIYNGINIQFQQKDLVCKILGDKFIVESCPAFIFSILYGLNKKEQFLADIEQFKIKNS